MNITCTSCGKEQATKTTKSGKSRLPRGWKRLGDGISCSKCMANEYALRAATVPIRPANGDWKGLETDLRAMWATSTAAANWILDQLYLRDVRRNGQDKMPPMPAIYLYPETREKFPSLPAMTASSLEHSIKRRWAAMRYEVLWTGGRTHGSFRYPYPYNVPAQAWNLSLNEDGVMSVSVPINGRRWDLILSGGNNYRREREKLKHALSDKSLAGELQLFRRLYFSSGNRKTHIICKIPVRVPKSKADQRTGTLTVRTDRDSFWVACDTEGKRVWCLNADQVRGWITSYDRRRHRLSGDLKFEARMSAKRRRKRQAVATRLAEKQRDRMNTWMHTAAVQLANFAQRRGIRLVEYDDSDAGYMPRYPWFVQRGIVCQKLDALGIEFEHARRKEEESSLEPLENKEMSGVA